MLLILLFSGFMGNLLGRDLLLDCAVAKMARGRKIEAKDIDPLRKEFPEASRGRGAYHKPSLLLTDNQVVTLTQNMLPVNELPGYDTFRPVFAEISDPGSGAWGWFCIEVIKKQLPDGLTHQNYRERLKRREGELFTYLTRLKGYIGKLSDEVVLQRAQCLSCLVQYHGWADVLRGIVISHIDSFIGLLSLNTAHYMPAHNSQDVNAGFYAESNQMWLKVTECRDLNIAFIPVQNELKTDSFVTTLYSAHHYAITRPEALILNNKDAMQSRCICARSTRLCFTLGMAYISGIPFSYAAIDTYLQGKFGLYMDCELQSLRAALRTSVGNKKWKSAQSEFTYLKKLHKDDRSFHRAFWEFVLE